MTVCVELSSQRKPPKDPHCGETVAVGLMTGKHWISGDNNKQNEEKKIYWQVYFCYRKYIDRNKVTVHQAKPISVCSCREWEVRRLFRERQLCSRWKALFWKGEFCRRWVFLFWRGPFCSRWRVSSCKRTVHCISLLPTRVSVWRWSWPTGAMADDKLKLPRMMVTGAGAVDGLWEQ